MNHHDEHDHTSDQPLSEIARILAGGILRLRSRAALSQAGAPSVPQIVPESGPNCLEVPPETVLSVHTG